jgi:O-antigen/teichoic acid export membrane protein
VSFKKELFRNILISGGYNYLAQGFNFLASIIISRILTPESYGIVGLIVVFTGFISVFSDGGLSYALIRSDYGKTFQRILTNLSWMLGLTLFVLTILLAYPIAIFYHNNQLILPTIVLGSTFLFKSLSLAQGALLVKELQFGFIGRVTLTCAIISILITLFMSLLGLGFWSLIIPQVITSILTIFFYERKVKLGFKIFPYRYILVGFKHTRRLIGSLIGFNAVNYWARNSDNLIVGKWYGASDLGIFSRSYALLTIPLNLITGLFNNILFPSLKKLKSENGNVKIEDEYYFVLRIINFLSLPLIAILIVFPDKLVILLWGDKWRMVAEMLPYYGLLIFTQTLLATASQILILEGKEKAFMLAGWVSSIILIGGIILGATISLKAIAEYYCLFYLAGSQSFCIFYLYIKTLRFDKKKLFIFWVPRILLSLLIWSSISFGGGVIKISLVLLLIIYTLFDGRKELYKFRSFFLLKVKKSLVNYQK